MGIARRIHSCAVSPELCSAKTSYTTISACAHATTRLRTTMNRETINGFSSQFGAGYAARAHKRRDPDAAISSTGRLVTNGVVSRCKSSYFDRLMYSIQQRWQALYSQTQNATGQQYDRAGNLIDDADAAIERFEQILQQIEELQNEFEKVRRIGEIVKQYRARVEAL